MASGTGTNDPPRIPAPDFTPETTSDFSKRHQPPLRGIMVDPDFPPTASEASKAFQESRNLPSEVAAELAAKPPPNLRRSSGASKVFMQAPGSGGEVINTIPGGDSLQPGRGRYSDDSAPVVEEEKVPPQATLGNALKSISLSDYRSFHQIPCVRTALLNGMVGGFGIGAAIFISGRTLWKASNYSVWSFLGVSGVSYQYCKYEMLKEREGMRAAVKIIDEKKEEKKRRYEEKKARALEARETRRIADEEAASQRRTWYRFWEGRGREG